MGGGGRSEDDRGENPAASVEGSSTPTPDQAAIVIGEPPSGRKGRFPVAGIGASAGGLEAFADLFRNLSLERTAAIVVQHLAPDHESVLPLLLARETSIPVETATDGRVLEPGHIYVIPPGADLTVEEGVLRLHPQPAAKVLHMPIDILFRSLAQDQGGSAIGIVLSGTGSDGTAGLRAIKEAGGIALVQDPETARYDSMPRSALQAGVVDHALSAREIGLELERITRHPVVFRPAPQVPAPTSDVAEKLARLHALIRAEFGTDLSQYKQTTIERRVERRMTLSKITQLDEYLKYVQGSHDELRALYDDMLIAVTSFFRDPEAFAVLRSTVLPQIHEHKDSGHPIRVWVPACATGEEAYSIGMCLLEFCEERSRGDRIQIFATDLDDGSVQHGRSGVYPKSIEAQVSFDRLNRFFVKRGDEYVVSRRLRDLLVFSRQNLLKDAPFSRIDLVSCRNFLIYLQPAAQRKLLRTLHYALNPGGYLFLGSSETVADSPELFSTVDRKNKIYSKRQVATPSPLETIFVPPAGGAVPAAIPPRPTSSMQGAADRKVLELYGPAGVIVNEGLEILHFRGHTGPFLDPTPGAASFNLLRVARFELHIELRAAIQNALDLQRRVTADTTYHDNGVARRVQLDVMPLADPETNARCVLVLFHSLPPPAEPAPESASVGDAPVEFQQRIEQLERELTMTREYLQSISEEKESALEELKSANEELQSANEELQSTNEELETSKEEMQATNEELTTVNEELHNRMGELSQTNDDLHNVLSGVDNAVVITGMDLRIRRYTAAAERLFHLVTGDVGRPVGYLDSFLQTVPLEPKVASVTQTLAPYEEEVLGQNRRWYTLRISPYKTLDHAIRGALVTLSDIDVKKRAGDVTRNVASYASHFLAAIEHPLLLIDSRTRIVWANASFLSRFQLTEEETVGSLLSGVGTRQLADPDLRGKLDGLFASGTGFRGFERRLLLPDGSQLTARLGASLVPASADLQLALLSIDLIGQPPGARDE